MYCIYSEIVDTERLFVNSDEIFFSSDERLKTNIKTMTNAKEKIMALRSVTYTRINKSTSEVPDIVKSYRSDNHNYKVIENESGFLAQEVLNIIPEAVAYDSVRDNYYINYISIIPYLVETIQDQNERIISLENKLNKNELNKVKAEESFDSKRTKGNSNFDNALLYQNSPNPFSKTTSIRAFIPQSAKHAELNIYDLNGKQEIHKEILDSQNVEIQIESGLLSPGIYLYTLIIDKQVIDTKQMILTH